MNFLNIPERPHPGFTNGLPQKQPLIDPPVIHPPAPQCFPLPPVLPLLQQLMLLPPQCPPPAPCPPPALQCAGPPPGRGLTKNVAGWPKGTIRTAGGYHVVPEGRSNWSIFAPGQRPGQKAHTR